MNQVMPKVTSLGGYFIPRERCYDSANTTECGIDLGILFGKDKTAFYLSVWENRKMLWLQLLIASSMLVVGLEDEMKQLTGDEPVMLFLTQFEYKILPWW